MSANADVQVLEIFLHHSSWRFCLLKGTSRFWLVGSLAVFCEYFLLSVVALKQKVFGIWNDYPITKRHIMHLFTVSFFCCFISWPVGKVNIWFFVWSQYHKPASVLEFSFGSFHGRKHICPLDMWEPVW